MSGDDGDFGQLMGYLQPDPEEPPMANFKFVHHNHYAVIVVSSSLYEEQARMYYEMGLEQAGPIMNSNTLAHFEIEAGRNLADILTPLATIVLLESTLFKFSLTTEPEAIVHAKELANTFGLHGRSAKRFLAMASLHSGSSLKLNFKSGTQVPQHFKDVFNSVSCVVPPIRAFLPPPVIDAIKEVLEHSGHEVYINMLTENLAFEIFLSLKGASRILDEDYIDFNMDYEALREKSNKVIG